MSENENQATARVTIDDVRAAVAGTDPNQIGAAKVRNLLGGKGSYETIQKHLNVLREELSIASAPVDPTSMPALPSDAAQAMWVAAWSAASVATMRRTEALSAERDAALLLVRTLRLDADDQVLTIDLQAQQLELAAQSLALANSSASAAATSAATNLDQLTQELSEVRAAAAEADKSAAAELAKSAADATHAAELAQQGREMMRGELQRLTDQIGELKANLYERASRSQPFVDVN